MVKTLRVAICLLLIVGVLAMSLSVFAYDLSDRLVGNGYLISYYIWQFLHSIGIDVTFKGVLEYNDFIADTIIDWVVAYIADLIEADSQPSNFSIAQWVAPWQADYDYWGNLQYNSTMLEDMQDFAEWLKREFSLIDDDSIVITPTYKVNGYTLFLNNKYYNCQFKDGTFSDTLVSIQSTDSNNSAHALGYFVAIRNNDYNTAQAIFVYTDSAGNGSAFINYYNLNGQNTGGSSTLGAIVGPNANGYYTRGGINQFKPLFQPSGPCLPIGQYFMYETDQEFNTFIGNFDVEVEGDIGIVTESIIMPSDNPDYTLGDGVTIIDGVPEYSVINIANVTVDNLPAIITQRTIPDIGNDEDNPGFSVPWQAVNGLIQFVAAPAGAIMSLVNEAPVEGAIMLYALIGGMIIFGMIRIMREH